MTATIGEKRQVKVSTTLTRAQADDVYELSDALHSMKERIRQHCPDHQSGTFTTSFQHDGEAVIATTTWEIS